MKKLLSLVLSLSLLLTMSTGFADNNEALSASKDVIENISLPEIIEEDEAIENKYVGRLAAMEQDLSTFVFANEDGTQTLRMFSHPVKFVDEEGKTKDITLDIAPAENGAFKTKDNSIITTFEKKLADGISLEYDDIDITMKPKLTSALSVASSNGKTVTYPYGRNTKIEYSLTYTGFKEDIVVEEYTGQTEYEFTLYTNGLKVEKIGEDYKVVDNEGNIKANIGDIIIFTVDERNNTFGELTCETVKENEEYLLTIHVDADYLSDPKTVYPIRIDPTIEINYSNSAETAIQDVTINSTGGSDGSSTSLRVGKRETYGISRILMKFPALSAYTNMPSEQVVKASVEIRDIICESDALEISCYQFTGNTWSESTANWSNVDPDSIGTLLSSNTVSYANGVALTNRHRYSFDITPAITAWKTSATAFNQGIIFKASSSVENGSTYISKTFSSYERSSNQPSLSIVYAGSVSISKTIDYVMVGKTKAISYTTTPSGLSLTWTSSNTSVATVNSSGVVTGVKPGIAVIRAEHYDPSTGAMCWKNVTMYVMNSVGIQDGKMYSISNYNTERIMSSDDTGSNIITVNRGDPGRYIWKIEQQTDGSFQIINSTPIVGQYGKVVNISGNNIALAMDTDAETSKFVIARCDIQPYDGFYLIFYGDYIVCQDSNYGVYLASSLTDNAYWSFVAYDMNGGNLFCFNHVQDDGVTFYTVDVSEEFENLMEYNSCYANVFVNRSAQTAYNQLIGEWEYFIHSGHGNAGIIAYNEGTDDFTGGIAVNEEVADWYIENHGLGDDMYYISDCDENGLAHLKIVLYFGCSTGVTKVVDGSSYNLVKATYEKGAHFVMGTSDTIHTDSTRWQSEFLLALQHHNIEEAIRIANYNAGDVQVGDDRESKPFPAYHIGDARQYIV